MTKPELLTFSPIAEMMIQKYKRYLPTAFDETLSMMEKVNMIIVYLNDIGEITNTMLERWNEVITWVTSDGVNEVVQERLDLMVQDGTLNEIINVTIFNELNQQIDTAQTDIESIKTTNIEQADDLSYLKGNDVIKRGDTWGTYENAVLRSVVANKAGGDVAGVLGIKLENDEKLAQYPNRDSVGEYVANSGRNATLDINTVTYTVNSVTVPVGTDLSQVKNGMIIDTKHSNKFSGFVVGVNGNVIQVKNWYQMENTALGQIPDNTAGIYVNPITKVWAVNNNVMLPSSATTNSGTGNETGFVNDKQDGGDTTIFDAVSLGTYGPSQAFRSRSSKDTNRNLVGYRSVNDKNAFVSDNSITNETLLNNVSSGFSIKNDGEMSRFKLLTGNSGNTLNISPNTTPVFLISSSDDHTISAPSGNGGKMIFVFNTTGVDVNIGGNFWQPTVAGSILVPARKGKIIFTDGGIWYHFDL